MTQPPASGRGPGAPGSGPQAPDGARGPRLAGFAQGGAWDTCPPSASLAAVAEELSGPQWRCEGATDDELIGLLGRWNALESWTAAAKLGVVRELIRRRARPGLNGSLPMHGDLPGRWKEGLSHEVSAALGISLRAADKAGKLAAQAACTVDPVRAAKRREMPEREQARVRFWRENGGACALAAYGLPTDAALAASAAINDRAGEYKNAKVRPDARMDQLRVLAFLEVLNGITLQARAEAEAAQHTPANTTENDEAANRPRFSRR